MLRPLPTLTAVLALCLSLPAAPGIAAERPLRSFIAPPVQDDGRPRAVAAPRIKVEPGLPRPIGMMAAFEPDRIPFTLTCSAAAASLADPATRGDDRCPAPFLVLAEMP